LRDDAIVEQIESNQSDAQQLREDVSKVGEDMTDPLARELLDREAKLREELKTVLEKVPPDSLDAYVLDDQKSLAKSLETENLPLLPADSELKPTPFPETPMEASCADSLTSVFADIVIEWFGLQEFEGALKLVIGKTPSLQEKVDALAKAVNLRDWEQAIDLSLSVLDILSKAESVNLFAKAIGEKEATRLYRAVIAKLGAKFVPFVGQVYAGITLATAIFRNTGRFVEITKCRLGLAERPG
jgi:hypothetical protein